MAEFTLGVPTKEKPRYDKMMAADGSWFIVVDEGHRNSIVCDSMYEWAVDWLVEQLQGKPFAPNTRPGE